MIKIACTSDTELFQMIETARAETFRSWIQNGSPPARAFIRRAIAATLKELSKNPFEIGTYERALDMGHTIAHPLEVSTRYELHHGFAVAIDLAFSCALSWSLGWLDQKTVTRIVNLLVSVGLPVWHEHLDDALVYKAFRLGAEHRGGDIEMVLPIDLGRYRFLRTSDECPQHAVHYALDWLRAVQSSGEATRARESAYALARDS
jgi:3-dehydroquinate synthase